MPWKPEIAPHAMVTNSSGTMLGVPSGTAWLTAGATIVGLANSTDRYRMPRPMNSWTPLM